MRVAKRNGLLPRGWADTVLLPSGVEGGREFAILSPYLRSLAYHANDHEFGVTCHDDERVDARSCLSQ